MAKKIIHLICNAHIDPVWQWEWEEGAAATVSTFRVAARFCEEYDGFVFNHNEALLYRWIEEYEPELFLKIQKLVKEGKWHIMGGWHLQPDCNIPSGEAYVRQILEGRRYFKEKFGAAPTTAINLDPFGHTRGLVQIMAKSGFDSYLFCRPNQDDCPLPADTFRWVGYDGSSVMGQRFGWYNSWLGRSLEKIKPFVEECKDGDFSLCLWGVGNHGGGPSKIDLDQIAQYQEQMKKEDIEVIHSTPEAYFKQLKESGKELPEHRGDLNRWAVGGYTSQIRIKQKYREIENMYFKTEKMCAAAHMQGLMEYPKKELDEVMYDMLTTQFHDTIPGTCIQPVEEASIRTLDHGLEILSRVKARAFFALSGGQKVAAADEIPVLVYNPHPFEVEGDFECEFMLWDQNRNPEFMMPVLYQDGKRVPCQPEKEMSNIPIEWRKRIVFHAKLAPMETSRFDCKFEVLPSKPVSKVASSTTHYLFASGGLEVAINKQTGLVDRYAVDGVDYLKDHAFSLQVVQDDFDPWGMNVNSFTNRIGEFTLLSDEEGSAFCALDQAIPSVRVIEDGEVRTVVEAIFGYESSRAVVQYKLPKLSGHMEMSIRIQWNEKQKMVKLAVPAAMEGAKCFGQVAYGVEEFQQDGKENAYQKYLMLTEGDKGICMMNTGTYGSSCQEDTMYLTLLRSAAYSAHPIDDRKVMPQDRFMPYSDQGERLFQFRFYAGKADEVKKQAGQNASTFNEAPMCLSFFPSGEGKKAQTCVIVESEDDVEMPAFKQTEEKDGYLIRLYHGADGEASAVLHIPAYGIEETIKFGSYEVKSFKASDSGLVPCDLMEQK